MLTMAKNNKFGFKNGRSYFFWAKTAGKDTGLGGCGETAVSGHAGPPSALTKAANTGPTTNCYDKVITNWLQAWLAYSI